MSGMVTGTRNVAVNNWTRSLYLTLYPKAQSLALSSPCLPVADSPPFFFSPVCLLFQATCWVFLTANNSNHQVWPLIPYIVFSGLFKQFQYLLHWQPLLYEFLLITTSLPIWEPAYLRHFSYCCSCLYSKLPVFLSYPFLLPKSFYKLLSALPLKQWEEGWFEENEAYFLKGTGTISPESFRDILQTI